MKKEGGPQEAGMKKEGGPQDHPVIVTVDNRYVRGNGEEVVETPPEPETVEVRRFDTAPAFVRRTFGLTIRLAPFENAKIGVEVQVPCYVQDLKLADEFASEFCKKRMEAEVSEILKKNPKNPL